jgi:non-lysosomal glucosylceramidase
MAAVQHAPGSRVERVALKNYQGANARHVAMPLGGVGAGQIAIGADGGLRQWQIFNQVNHAAFVPHSFFAIRATTIEPPLDVIRILQSSATLDLPEGQTPLVNDDLIPSDQRKFFDAAPGVAATRFSALYPFARIAYDDPLLPVEVSLETYTPFVPHDAEASGLPAIVFSFTVTNNGQHEVNGCIGATLQNAVGWDGITPIDGASSPLYGGNTNRVRRRGDTVSIVMENPSLSEDHPGAGQMVLTACSPDARSYERWTDPKQFIRFLEGLNPARAFRGHQFEKERSYRNMPVTPIGPSPAGSTWDGGLAIPFWLQPGESTTITVLLSWYFPNRFVNFDQFGKARDFGRSRFWLGNAYGKRFADAVDVSEQLLAHKNELEMASRQWENVLRDTTLPAWLVETLAAQGSLIRSPTSFWAEDGKFFGFEGSLGLSTGMWNGVYGGSCPLNCTHVWNYELALSKLFPTLERTMRETDLEKVQAPEGYIPHRTIAPLYLPQLWNEPIGGPTNPALDGMLGEVLKVYREVREYGDVEWFARLWPRVEKLLTYIIAKWDDDNDGVLQGEQPNTYDIAFFGPNMYIGALWLAALRAGEEMAKIAGNESFATGLHDRFERGSAEYDRLLWNGSYYIQLIDDAAPPEDQFGIGCLTDQLFGQWWAHLLDLGHILPEAHVKATLRSIVEFNTRQGFQGFDHGYRVFADQDDTGLLICTWPQGGRPDIPVRYCDEVWTGIEYQVAAHCIMEGEVESGLQLIKALRDRYDGSRRNPYNEIECGDHYSRAMAGWSALEAITGVRYDGMRGSLKIAPAGSPEHLRAPVVFGEGWGTLTWRKTGTEHEIRLMCANGHLALRQITLGNDVTGAPAATVDGRPIAVADGTNLAFDDVITLKAGSLLTIRLSS